MHYVIIGNGGAGISALQAIRETDSTSEITIISREKYPAYSPCSLPNLLAGEVEKQTIIRFDRGFYRRLDARFMKNSEALRISPDSKEVELANGSTLRYDRLLVAAGAMPIAPRQLKGLGLKGVHIMGTMDAVMGILRDFERGARRAVVVGGGFMGVETAVMLKKRGMDVTIVELLPRVLSRMLDPDLSQKVEEILVEHGLDLILNDAVMALNGNGNRKVSSVSLGSGKAALRCDMVVIAIGVTPNTGLVRESGISINRGIPVDTTMKTNVEDIYAAGDIVEVHERIGGTNGSFAIWPNAVEQGRIAGLNMAGVHTEYSGADVVNVLDVFDIPVVAMGSTSEAIEGENGKNYAVESGAGKNDVVEGDAEKNDVVESGAGKNDVVEGDAGKNCETIYRSTPHSHKKLMLKDGRIVGLQFMGDIRNTGILYSLMKKGTDVSGMKERLLDENYVHPPTSVVSPGMRAYL